jgi:hypothetical protein
MQFCWNFNQLTMTGCGIPAIYSAKDLGELIVDSALIENLPRPAFTTSTNGQTRIRQTVQEILGLAALHAIRKGQLARFLCLEGGDALLAVSSQFETSAIHRPCLID